MFATMSISAFGVILGACGLIAFLIFHTLETLSKIHSHLPWIFAGIFVGAIFIVGGYGWYLEIIKP